jgi:putative ABC transport system ATP-binding protein
MEDETQVVYELIGVTKEFSRSSVKVIALKKVNLKIEQGRFVALVGPSGSGKSTLLQLLGALEQPSEGNLFFKGRNLAKLGDKELTELRAREIGFVFQSFNLIPTLSAIENVELAMIPIGVDKSMRKERSAELLKRVGLAERINHLPSRLSGGEQQRVAIARALANEPSVLIADEPTGNLDSKMSEEIMGLFAEIRELSGVTIVMATHDLQIAARADRRITLHDGEVASDS